MRLRWMLDLKIENVNGVVVSVLVRGRWLMWMSAHPFKVFCHKDEES